MTLRRLLAALAVSVALAGPMTAAAAISASDQTILSAAIDAGEHKDWPSVAAYAQRASDSTVATIIRWRYLIDRQSGATYADLVDFLGHHPNWPNAKTMQANAEKAMPVDLPTAQVLAFFKDREPATGEGMLALGIAKLSAGDTTEGPIWIRRGYVSGSFSADREAAIRTQYAQYLPADADKLRLAALLWADDFAGATRMLTYVDPGTRALGQARLKLRSNTKGAQKFIDAVPASLKDDFGLMFDMGRWYRRSEQYATGARFMARAIRDPAVPLPLDKWWDEKSAHVRMAIKERRFQDAYAVAASGGMSEGADLAEAEFLAGWMKLRFLNDARGAFTHFNRIAPAVTTPISLARGHYWTARAREAAGDEQGALTEYGYAARHIETYYGQLAAARLSASPTITVDLNSEDSRVSLDNDELVQAIAALAAVGDTRLLPRFVGALGERLEKRQDFEAASALLLRLGRPAMSVRVAKRAMQKDIHVFRYSYPVVRLPAYRGHGEAPDPAFVHALIRQESEFDPNVRSSADARGFMQLLPSTAKLTANKHGLDYDASRLIGDWEYNATIGMAHLRDLLDQFGGSYVLVAVAYNAGPGRARQWIAEFGDPRSPNVDVVDWVERIPFEETRNYVMRLIENTNVYRAMLNGGTAPLLVEADLMRGSGQTDYEPGRMQASEALR
ncbi:MAG: lytic transglycosylase domain-containing protein [Alphaproteobacteria bacterium]|nr:lytic transglycosylase domain-containing protein [Alphaproteobacteria bacterium]